MTERLKDQRPAPRNERGFTLVELLVCIGIIAILVSMLLPTMGRARSAANTALCLSNLRGIGQAMTVYFTENNGWLPGSAHSSAKHIWQKKKVGANNTAVLLNGYTITNIPRVNEMLDWIGPLARVMRLDDPRLAGTDGVARYQFYVNSKQFSCPAYAGTMAFPNTTDPAFNTTPGALPALGYTSAQTFMLVSNTPYLPTQSDKGLAANVCLPQAPYWTLPDDYTPRISKVGPPSQKIFVADGARRSRNFTATAFQITYSLSSDPKVLQTNETTYSDYGPFTGLTRSYGRTSLKVNTTTPVLYDTRILSMRHGKSAPRSIGSVMRMNVVFFDGHAENMVDMAACDPNLWLPRGTQWTLANMTQSDGSTAGTDACYTDVYNTYMKGVTASLPFVAN